MKKIILLLTFLNVLTFSQSNFDFEFDYAQFGYDSTSNYVEFYYSFNQASLTVSTNNATPTLEGILKIFIKNVSTGEPMEGEA